MYVHSKLSGELLAAQGEPGELWTPNGSRSSVDKIATLHRQWSHIGLSGLMLVSGAGNVMRGDELRKKNLAKKKEDILGRLFTVANTLYLANELQQRGVPVSVFIANTMTYSDALNTDLAFTPYSEEDVAEAYQKEHVALVAGGTGKNGQSTDAAVLEYAAMQKRHTPDAKIVAIKGTKFDGVFDGDPQLDASVARFKRISAGYMLANYERLSAVDKRSLEIIQESGIPLRVYADGHHDYLSVLNGGKEEIGTLIVAEDIEPEFAA